MQKAADANFTSLLRSCTTPPHNFTLTHCSTYEEAAARLGSSAQWAAVPDSKRLVLFSMHLEELSKMEEEAKLAAEANLKVSVCDLEGLPPVSEASG